MAGKNQHVAPRENRWAFMGDGNQLALSIHGTQQQAINAARAPYATKNLNSSFIARMAVSVTGTATAMPLFHRKAEAS